MSDNIDVKAFKSRLEALLEELEATDSSAADAASVVELDQTRVGRLSRMDAMQAQSMAKESQRRREAMKLAAQAALKRIEQGTYGLCKECEEPIAAGRLQVDPTATLCINCAS